MSSLLSASSFSLYTHLSLIIEDERYTPAQLELAIQHKITSAFRIGIKQHQQGSAEWLLLATSLARHDGEYAWQLHQYYQQRHNQRNSQYYAERARAMQYRIALIAKARDLAKKQQYTQAIELLEPIDDQHTFDLALTYAISSGDKSVLATLLTSTFVDANIMAELTRYGITDSDKLSQVTLNCPYPIQFFASDIHLLRKVDGQINRINQHPLLAKQFCFTPPRYVARQDLLCTDDKSQQLACYFSQPAQKKIHPKAHYLGVISNQGIANVNNGVIFIDKNDSIAVLEHELWHLLGFIDEYPLPSLHQACAGEGSPAHNISVIESTLFATEYDAKHWVNEHVPWASFIENTVKIGEYTSDGFKLGTPNKERGIVGLYPARTCDNNGKALQAYKPFYQHSKMEYYETTFPALYVRLFEQAGNKHIMPSYYHYFQQQLKLTDR